MLIKTLCLWILFIDRHALNPTMLHPIFNEQPSQAVSPFVRNEKQHFKAAAIYSHKSDQSSAFLSGDDKPWNQIQRPGNVFLDLFYFTAG